jgi:hypothetical protein
MSRFGDKQVARSCLFVCVFAVVVVEPDEERLGADLLVQDGGGPW